MTTGFDFGAEADATNQQFAARLATLTTLSATDIERLLPTRADKESLAELISIVNAATTDHQRLASLRGRFEQVGGTVLKLLGTVIR
jgi:hypothetical protein